MGEFHEDIYKNINCIDDKGYFLSSKFNIQALDTHGLRVALFTEDRKNYPDYLTTPVDDLIGNIYVNTFNILMNLIKYFSNFLYGTTISKVNTIQMSCLTVPTVSLKDMLCTVHDYLNSHLISPMFS